MFNIGDKVRLIKKCKVGDACEECPPIGYIGMVVRISENGKHIALEGYRAISMKLFERVVEKAVPLPLPG